MKRILTECVLLAFWALTFASMPARAEDFARESFLSDYSKLQPLSKSPGGNDFVYLAPGVENGLSSYRRVLVDEPEVFLSPDSPYKGGKPADIAAIAGAVRSTVITALRERGYAIAEQPAADVLYVRLAVTGLEIKKKSRRLLAYTPVGFVVDAGVKALQGFMDKYEMLDMSLQVEVQDSVKRDVLAAVVLQRGETAGAKKPIEFDVMMAATNEFGERFACRLDNGRVPADQRIDCTNPAVRKARPLIGSQ